MLDCKVLFLNVLLVFHPLLVANLGFHHAGCQLHGVVWVALGLRKGTSRLVVTVIKLINKLILFSGIIYISWGGGTHERWLLSVINLAIECLGSMLYLMLSSTFFRPEPKAHGLNPVWIFWIAPSGVVNRHFLITLGQFVCKMHLIGCIYLIWRIKSLFSYWISRLFHNLDNLVINVDVFRVHLQVLTMVHLGCWNVIRSIGHFLPRE